MSSGLLAQPGALGAKPGLGARNNLGTLLPNSQFPGFNAMGGAGGMQSSLLQMPMGVKSNPGPMGGMNQGRL